MDVGRFSAMAMDGRNLLVYDWNKFSIRYSVSRAETESAGITKVVRRDYNRHTNSGYAIHSMRAELLYCRRLPNATDARMQVEDEVPQLRCWFFDKPYSSHYFMHSGSHHTRTMEFEVC